MGKNQNAFTMPTAAFASKDQQEEFLRLSKQWLSASVIELSYSLAVACVRMVRPNSSLKLTVRRRFSAGRAGCRVSNLHGVAPLAQAL